MKQYANMAIVCKLCSASQGGWYVFQKMATNNRKCVPTVGSTEIVKVIKGCVKAKWYVQSFKVDLINFIKSSSSL